ncbi:winged helix-turn-helix domain-containing protein [Streptomyces sp. NBC_00237]|uniref:ArsR/SmtB family transcription factor n=1 Tax=Streptomyces sp. NBC_00237 TaxID=2975687 RepID=UPI00224CEA8A|nr:winged helix-turn-helix domain-containing protein [Streptomyces sp. NBC_00237]MCX5206433.1 winged helix-turn-helix domain-containing protein [Streptomyces sp. NBC_00237]
MIRIHFTAEDLARLRFAPRPAPVPELHAALMTLGSPPNELADEPPNEPPNEPPTDPPQDPLHVHWRTKLVRALPAATGPLADLVPDGRPPAFLDVVGESLDEGCELIRSARPEVVRAEIERSYGRRPAPPWIRALHSGLPEAWRIWERAQRAAYESVLAPVWPLIQDLHRAEFTRHALAVAEHGLGAALTAVAPGSCLHDGVWELPPAAPPFAPTDAVRDVHLSGRGLVLFPTFHWRPGPLVQDLPDQPGRPVSLAYPAGPGIPHLTSSAPQDAGTAPLAGVIGRTRLALLRALDESPTTTGLALRLGVSNATASAHASALRAAGLLTTTRTGLSVRHTRTPLADLLVGG